MTDSQHDEHGHSQAIIAIELRHVLAAGGFVHHGVSSTSRHAEIDRK